MSQPLSQPDRMTETHPLLEPLLTIHAQIRDAVVAAFVEADTADLARVVYEGEGDTIYAVDRVSEELLVASFEQLIAPLAPMILIAEGLSKGHVVLPRGAEIEEAQWRIIVDPIDGTRGLMYQKRSAWILTGVAPNLGPQTNLQDITLAIQTEIPLLKQHLSDVLWAEKGQGCEARRINRLTGDVRPLVLQPSRATTIAHGFASVARFFPGAREELAAIDEEIARAALGPIQAGKAQSFEDQYICSGGQLYELMSGHDRFIADLRPLMDQFLARRGQALGICCHPYDVCTELIARELGVIISSPNGRPLRAGLTVHEDVAWTGYANAAIQAQVEPLLQAALQKRGLR